MKRLFGQNKVVTEPAWIEYDFNRHRDDQRDRRGDAQMMLMRAKAAGITISITVGKWHFKRSSHFQQARLDGAYGPRSLYV